MASVTVLDGVITVEKRPDDYWLAFPTGNRAVRSCGRTRDEAIGALVQSAPEHIVRAFAEKADPGRCQPGLSYKEELQDALQSTATALRDTLFGRATSNPVQCLIKAEALLKDTNCKFDSLLI